MTACNSVLKVSAFKVNHIFQKAKTSHRSPQVHVITKVSADLTQGSRWRLCHQLTRGLGHVLLPHHVSCPLSYTGSRGPAGAPGAPDPLSHSAAAIFWRGFEPMLVCACCVEVHAERAPPCPSPHSVSPGKVTSS